MKTAAPLGVLSQSDSPPAAGLARVRGTSGRNTDKVRLHRDPVVLVGFPAPIGFVSLKQRAPERLSAFSDLHSGLIR
jgi:hypothetical protein